MKKLIETLRSLGIEVPEDKEAEVRKKLSENYKNISEVEKATEKLESDRDTWKEYVRINIMEPPTADGIYPAVKRKCSYQFDSIGGEAGSELVNSMTLGGIGDGEIGRFNVKEAVWLPAEEAE